MSFIVVMAALMPACGQKGPLIAPPAIEEEAQPEESANDDAHKGAPTDETDE